MPHKTWQVGEEVLASDFGPVVSEQVVCQFPSAANRAANWTPTSAGAMSYLQDSGTYWTWNGTAWVPFGARGVLAFGEDPTSATVVPQAASPTLLPNSTITCALPAGRKLRVTANVQFGIAANAAATGQLVVRLQDAGSTVLQERWHSIIVAAASGMSCTIPLEKIIQPTVAQTYTFRLFMFTNTAGNTNTFAQKMTIVAEDVGGV